MQERGFVDALIESIRKSFPDSAVMRPSDNYSLGIADVLAWIPGTTRSYSNSCPWAVAIEAKSLHPLMEDPFHRGRRTGQMLKHPFTGPQVSLLRMLRRASVEAFGLVRASEDTAFRIEPDKLPADTGNFTHDELMFLGKAIRRVNGVWRFWETQP